MFQHWCAALHAPLNINWDTFEHCVNILSNETIGSHRKVLPHAPMLLQHKCRERASQLGKGESWMRRNNAYVMRNWWKGICSGETCSRRPSLRFWAYSNTPQQEILALWEVEESSWFCLPNILIGRDAPPSNVRDRMAEFDSSDECPLSHFAKGHWHISQAAHTKAEQ